MDLSSWDVSDIDGALWIRLFFDGDEDHDHAEETGWIKIPDWMADRFATAILTTVEHRRRTRRDGNRRMMRATHTGQFWCEPCLLEVDAPGVPAITHIYHGANAVCCVCGFSHFDGNENRRRDNADQTDARPVGVDQGADTG